MSTHKNVLILALVAVIVGLGGIAWVQHRALQDLQAKHAALLAQERADYMKRLAAVERARDSLERDLADIRQLQSGESRKKSQTRVDVSPNRSADPAGTRGSMLEPFGMENPQMQKFMASQQRAGLDARYAALFKGLKLSSADLEKFKSLLIDKQTLPIDVMAAARAAGLNPRLNQEQFNALMRTSMDEVDVSIKTTLGEAGFAQYNDYEKTMLQRTVANQLVQRLSYSDSPLNDSQTEQLIRILAETAAAGSDRPASAVAPFIKFASAAPGNVTFTTASPGMSMTTSVGSSSAISNDTINRAASILSPTQLQALTELQRQQQSQAALIESMRNQPPGGSGGGTFITREAITTLPLPATNSPAPTRAPGGG